MNTHVAPSPQFTEEQHKVVAHSLEQHACVTAVAGAGKTTTLIARLGFLLEQGVPARQIGVFMFNKSAQEEFVERMRQASGAGPSNTSVAVMTFHAFGMRLCRSMERQALLPAAHLMTEEFGQLLLIREAMQRVVREDPTISLKEEKDWLEDALLFIEQVKASGQASHLVYEAGNWSAETRFFPALYEQCERIRKQKAQRGFSDLILDPLEALRTLKDGRELASAPWIPQYRYLLIDEFQDINPAQYELLSILYADRAHWMIVGDTEQCIYQWRGADPNIMAKQFFHDFPQVESYVLSQSFRFGHSVGLMASQLLKHNQVAHSVMGLGQQTEVCFASSDRIGQALLRELKRWHSEGRSLDKSAVLVRLYSDMVPVQLALMHAGLPYQLYGESPLLDNPQIRMLMAYLAVMAGALETPSHFHSREDIDWLVKVPSLGLSPQQRNAFSKQCQQAPHLLPQLIENLADQSDGWRAKKQHQRADWLRSLTLYRQQPAEGLRLTLQKLGIERYFESTSNKSIQLEEKLATCDAFISYVEGLNLPADDVLKQLAALTNAESTNAGPHLMSIHKAKGLEFDLVLMAGLQDGRFPYLDQTLESPDMVAAERRLFYVGITRARQRLVLLKKPDQTESKALQAGQAPQTIPRNEGLSRFVYEADTLNAVELAEALTQGEQRELTLNNSDVAQRYLHQLAEKIPEDHIQVSIRSATSGEDGRRKDKSLRAGDRVRHDQFGEGVVVRQDATGSRMIYVEFVEQGLKRFNPKFTRLVRTGKSRSQ